MKTNTSPKTIVMAVENVSKRKYDGNIVFRKTPEKMTKNVVRFTLRTLDANGKGSLVTKQGVKQTKANWDVHQDVMREILRLDPRPHIYVDTIYGREHNQGVAHHVVVSNEPTGVQESETQEPAMVVEEQQDSTKKQESPTRKKRGRPRLKVEETTSGDNNQVMNIVKAIKYILQNPAILNERGIKHT